jgi:hypothetical protein
MTENLILYVVDDNYADRVVFVPQVERRRTKNIQDGDL